MMHIDSLTLSTVFIYYCFFFQLIFYGLSQIAGATYGLSQFSGALFHFS